MQRDSVKRCGLNPPSWQASVRVRRSKLLEHSHSRREQQ
nr:MAG TPA: hypothetical protein [Caudoviricetes sp.]